MVYLPPRFWRSVGFGSGFGFIALIFDSMSKRMGLTCSMQLFTRNKTVLNIVCLALRIRCVNSEPVRKAILYPHAVGIMSCQASHAQLLPPAQGLAAEISSIYRPHWHNYYPTQTKQRRWFVKLLLSGPTLYKCGTMNWMAPR